MTSSTIEIKCWCLPLPPRTNANIYMFLTIIYTNWDLSIKFEHAVLHFRLFLSGSQKVGIVQVREQSSQPRYSHQPSFMLILVSSVVCRRKNRSREREKWCEWKERVWSFCTLFDLVLIKTWTRIRYSRTKLKLIPNGSSERISRR